METEITALCYSDLSMLECLSDEDRDRAALLALAEDAIIRGFQLSQIESENDWCIKLFEKLLELANLCSIDVLSASATNVTDGNQYPIREAVFYTGDNTRLALASSILHDHLEKHRYYLEKTTKAL